MIDISHKPPVTRQATAAGRIILRRETIEKIKRGEIEKGDPLQIATIAAIMAAKNTPQILPLCHPIPIHNIKVDYEIGDTWIEAKVTVKTKAETGVEMEALTGVTAALLAIWDTVKKHEKDEHGQYPHTKITNIRVLKKQKQKPNHTPQ